MERREKRDQNFLEAYEEIQKTMWQCKEKYDLLENENHPQALRFRALMDKLTTERRLLEEISLPCRCILEHFTSFMGKPDQAIGFRLGLVEAGKGILNDFTIDEWGNIHLVIGNIRLGWRDKDYQYLFYPDKAILRSYDRSKPEIHLLFNFAFKYSKVIDSFRDDIVNDPQTLYWHPDLNEEEE